MIRVESESTEYLARGEAELAELLAGELSEGLLLGGLPEAVVRLLYGDGAGPWAGSIRELIRSGRRPYEVRFTGDYGGVWGGSCEVDDGHGYRGLYIQHLDMTYWLLRERSPPELVEYVQWFFLRGWHCGVCSWMRDATASRKRIRGAVEVLGGGPGVYVMVRKRGSDKVRAHLSASGLVLGGTPDAFLGDGGLGYGRAPVAPDVRMGRWEAYLGGSFMRVLGVVEGRVEVMRSWDAVRAVESGGAVILSSDGSLDCPVLGLFELGEWGPVPTRAWAVSAVDSGGDQ